MIRVLRAAFIAPIDRPMLRDGAIAIEDGAICAVGEAAQVVRDFSSATVEDLGQVVLLPGLVNAHTHLELSDREIITSTTDVSFIDWLMSARGDASRSVATAVQIGVDQCLRFGVTSVGDISQSAAISRTTLGAMSRRPRVVSFGEVLGLAKRRFRFDALLAQAIDDTHANESLRIAISPHAPYTVDQPGYEQCLAIAREKKLPIATHLSESPDERAFIESHSGPFRELWDRLGSWSEPVPTYRGSPIEFADAIGLLDHPTLFAHVNYCDDAELDLLAKGKASVVYCPRTHRYFGHPKHPWREMIARGVNVAVGTDSCASSPDLNLVDELRLLHEIDRSFAIETLWEMATLRAARAIQMQDEVGSISPRKRADLVSFAISSNDPLREILESSITPKDVWIDGERITSSTPAPASRG